jgi:hypothetical protein
MKHRRYCADDDGDDDDDVELGNTRLPYGPKGKPPQVHSTCFTVNLTPSCMPNVEWKAGLPTSPDPCHAQKVTRLYTLDHAPRKSPSLADSTASPDVHTMPTPDLADFNNIPVQSSLGVYPQPFVVRALQRCTVVTCKPTAISSGIKSHRSVRLWPGITRHNTP